jgi:hypothetical protein
MPDVLVNVLISYSNQRNPHAIQVSGSWPFVGFGSVLRFAIVTCRFSLKVHSLQKVQKQGRAVIAAWTLALDESAVSFCPIMCYVGT